MNITPGDGSRRPAVRSTGPGEASARPQDVLADVIRLDGRPSVESLAEVHAEAVLRASARRWAHVTEARATQARATQVPATGGRAMPGRWRPAGVRAASADGAPRLPRRTIVAAVLTTIAVLGVTVAPALAHHGAPAPSTLWQHAPASSTSWDPWQDPMAGRG